jgi:3-oxo-5-alpha-steroid 4-dehydrogenase 1
MTERSLFPWLLGGWLAVAILVCILLRFINAPYGRYTRAGWGAGVNSRLGWVLMESASALGFALLFLLGSARGVVAWVFLAMWEAHYVHRAFIYPLQRRDSAQRMPLLIIAFGFAFNALNVYLNGRWLFHFAPEYHNSWLTDPRFLLGAGLFMGGYIINRQSDGILRGLRTPGGRDYVIPNGGFYRWVSSPNYLGEIILWTGWAIATWSLPGLGFLLWTVANLAPRARANHLWYRDRFADYPPARKALLPGLW